MAGCIGYPYTDFADRIPRDFLWMYPALLVAPLFAMLTAVIHDGASTDRRRFALIGFGFALMAAALLTADYVIQLRVVQPAVLIGELDGLAPLTQYNPHGVFIALEEAGYLLMAVAFLFAGLALPRHGAWERAARWTFIGGFVLVVSLCGGLLRRTASTWNTDSRSPPYLSTGRCSSSTAACLR